METPSGRDQRRHPRTSMEPTTHLAAIYEAAGAGAALHAHPPSAMALSFAVATHGSFAVGHSLEEALSVSTTLEMSAKIALMVRALGGHPARPKWTRRRRRVP